MLMRCRQFLHTLLLANQEIMPPALAVITPINKRLPAPKCFRGRSTALATTLDNPSKTTSKPIA